MGPFATWLQHFFGFNSGTGNQSHYLFWSGAGSDLGELAIVGALLGLLRKHNCEVKGCWRLGRHSTDGGHTVCARHMPGGAPTHADVLAAHHAARKARQ